MLAPNSHKVEKNWGNMKLEYGRIWGEEDGNADYGGMVQPSQQIIFYIKYFSNNYLILCFFYSLGIDYNTVQEPVYFLRLFLLP